MKSKIIERDVNANVSRRALLQAGAGLIGGALLPGAALAEDHAAIGTYPAGTSGSSVFIGISVPRTGTYALQGEDELKGYQLAVEHINSGHDLIRKISPKTAKGVLGKEVKYGVADSAAKPNEAVQAEQRFISENKAVLMTGSTSSAAQCSTCVRSLDPVGGVATHLATEFLDGLFDAGSESTNVLVVATAQRGSEGDDDVVAPFVGSVEV